MGFVGRVGKFPDPTHPYDPQIPDPYDPRFIMKIPMQSGRIPLARGGRPCCSAGSGAAQAPQTPPSVTFQVEVNYVDVDAIVTDENGNFVTGLTREDFEVFEDGKPQKVEMFSYVELPVERPDRFAALGRPVSTRRPLECQAVRRPGVRASCWTTSTSARSARPREERGARVRRAPFRRERSRGGRLYERPHRCHAGLHERSRAAVAAIDKFVGRRLRSAAIEALEQHYHESSRRLNRQENYVDPGAGIKDTAAPINIRDLEREQRALAVLDTLRNLGEFLAGVRGRRKAVLLFSEGLEMPMSEIYGMHTPTDVVGAIKDAITAAARSNVNFFALDPRGLIGMTSEYIETGRDRARPTWRMGVFGAQRAAGPSERIRLSQDSLRTLAEETGGFAAVNQNTLGSAFERIVDANSRYYVLGYYPPSTARDGRFHRIEVRTKRPGLRVSARRGYASPRGRTPAERKRDEESRRAREARRGGVNNTSPELRDALNAPLQQSGLTFTMQAAPFKLTQKEASVALAIEFDGAPLPFTSPDSGGAGDKHDRAVVFRDQPGRQSAARRREPNST